MEIITEQEYLDAQAEYNETGDRNILFTTMRQYIHNVAWRSLRKLKGYGYKDYEKLDYCCNDVTDAILNRYIKNQHYSKNKPLTMVWLTARAYCYNLGYRHKYWQNSIELGELYESLEKNYLSYDSFEDDLIERLTEEGY